MMRWLVCRTMLLGGFIISGVGSLYADAPADPKRDAITAFQKRQERARSLSMILHIRQTYLNELAFGPVTGALPAPANAPGTLFKNRLLLDGASLRYEDNTFMRPFRGDNVNIQSREVLAYNGLVGKRYFPEVTATRGQHLGFMVAKGPPRNFASPYLIPIWFHVRSREPLLNSIEIDGAQPTDRTEMIDGRSCRVFRLELAVNREILFWLDPARDYIPCRILRQNGTNILWQNDITYQAHPQLGWLPSAWKFLRYTEGGPLVESWETTVADVRVNEPIDAAEFELSFPVETQVIDEETGQQYVVQTDGSWRELSTSTGLFIDEVPVPEVVNFPRYGYLIIVVAIAGVLFVLGRRRVNRPK